MILGRRPTLWTNGTFKGKVGVSGLRTETDGTQDDSLVGHTLRRMRGGRAAIIIFGGANAANRL
jgi:hypothetical protein